MENIETAEKAPAVPYRSGDKLPAAMGPADMMRAFGMTKDTYYSHHKTGKFDRFKFKHPIGIKKFSGALVERYLAGGGK